MISISTIVNFLNESIPLAYQEKYDNSGLLVSTGNTEIKGILTTLDIDLEILEEAKSKNCNMVVAHHPLIFGEIKKISSKTEIGQCIIYAIKNDISIYALHTNLDNIKHGVSYSLGKKLNLKNIKILKEKKGYTSKIKIFCPEGHVKKVKEALFNEGAGSYEKYTNCSFTLEGIGSFVPNKHSRPYIGYQLQETNVKEVSIEMVFPSHKTNRIVSTLKEVHPYEEPAYYINILDNYSGDIGTGVTGELEDGLDVNTFLDRVKKTLNHKYIKHGIIKNENKVIKKIGLCGGSGSFLIEKAMSEGCDAYLTADIKYHDYFLVQKNILLVDIGHYESELHTKSIICELLSKKFTNIAILQSKINTNPVFYS